MMSKDRKWSVVFFFLSKTGSVCLFIVLFYFILFLENCAVCKHFLIPSEVKVIVKAKCSRLSIVVLILRNGEQKWGVGEGAQESGLVLKKKKTLNCISWTFPFLTSWGIKPWGKLSPVSGWICIGWVHPTIHWQGPSKLEIDCRNWRTVVSGMMC